MADSEVGSPVDGRVSPLRVEEVGQAEAAGRANSGDIGSPALCPSHVPIFFLYQGDSWDVRECRGNGSILTRDRELMSAGLSAVTMISVTSVPGLSALLRTHTAASRLRWCALWGGGDVSGAQG